jgi:putative SOS response-associated peptidase YedK
MMDPRARYVPPAEQPDLRAVTRAFRAAMRWTRGDQRAAMEAAIAVQRERFPSLTRLEASAVVLRFIGAAVHAWGQWIYGYGAEPAASGLPPSYAVADPDPPGWPTDRIATPPELSQVDGMCARGAQHSDPATIARRFSVDGPLPNLVARWNAAPTQEIGVIRRHPETGVRTLEPLRWGLVPSWSKDEKPGFSTINARAEAVTSSPAYRNAWEASRRCLVPFDLFYEWKKLEDGVKEPYAIAAKDRLPMGLAGLWETKKLGSSELLRTFTIITCAPNSLVATVHNRMPAVVRPELYGAWLGDDGISLDDARNMLRPYPANEMETWRVDPRVGNWRNDDPSLARPLGDTV